ncbi:hypothetical protein GCM10010405_49780 [Streptomyces macrosporus]|uniref:Uncharacterized protein n=1 Tax=Streptomyces macrosporus TaxID=44032 RepID=A0ABN3KH94_9ACTN
MVPQPNPMNLSLDAPARDFSSIPLTIGAVLDIRGTAPSLKALREHITACLPRLPALRHYLDGPRLKARVGARPATTCVRPGPGADT